MKKVLLTSAAVLAVFAAAAPAFAYDNATGPEGNGTGIYVENNETEVKPFELPALQNESDRQGTVDKNNAAEQEGVPGSHAKTSVVVNGQEVVISNNEVKGTAPSQEDTAKATAAADKAKAAEAKTSAKAAAKTLPNTSAVK